MKRLVLGLRMLWRILTDATFSSQVKHLMGVSEQTAPPAEKAPPCRSEALTLLASLQREARFVDFVMETLDGYTDAQIGAAVRDVQRDSRALIERQFGLESLASEAEGARFTVPHGFDPAAFRLTGQLAGDPPYHGVLRHHGWKATRCEIPTWTGKAESSMIVAPVEVEMA